LRIVNDFPRRVREIETEWIPLSDGCRLAARIWLPEDASDNPVPAILEYLPYRRSDGTAVRDSVRHPYLAGHGYAMVRVDIRGTGDSDGVIEDEYSRQELVDALEVISWIARRPWCTGSVGMFGISWGGFNSLQVAALRPPELKAIITLCSTDDRYADDVHYNGGCVSGLDMLSWATSMLTWNALPPDPEVVGARWREAWLERLDRTPPFIEPWLRHQRRDAYWKHGSVCEDYSAITCAVYAVGGWVDGYTNSVFRLLEGLSCPRKGLIGPWAHSFPEQGVPGPAIGFLQEALRWWDHWLKGEENGVMAGPMLRAWMQETVEPRTTYDVRPGRWVGEPSWPSPGIRARRLTLFEGPMEIIGAQSAGADAGAWCAEGQAADLAPDQRAEDGLSLTFTSAPLAAPLEILGHPEAYLELAVDRPVALVAVRLCEVLADGRSTLITRGLLNLTHRKSHEHAEALQPGERFSAVVRLKAIAHSFASGSRIRVAVSPTYWPWAWPSPEPVRLTVFGGPRTMLTMPERPRRDTEDAGLPAFDEPELAAGLEVEQTEDGPAGRYLTRDQASGRVEQVFDWDVGGARRIVRSNLEMRDSNRTVFAINEGDPLSARVDFHARSELKRGSWCVSSETRAAMTCDAESFHVTSELEVREGEGEVARRTWTFTFPRDLV
jgi:predicted acyl esterase